MIENTGNNKNKQRATKMKYFKFYCKAVPSSTLLDTSKPMADQSYYKEFSKDESIQMDAVGMPLYLKHINGIEKEDKEDHSVIKYIPDRHLMGYVVSKDVGEDGNMNLLVEIPPVSEKHMQTREGKAINALRNTAIKLIKDGYYQSVSLSHGLHDRYDGDYDADIIQKYPLELSLTNDPAREGSSIMTYYETDERYPVDTSVIKGFDPVKAGVLSALDRKAQDRNRLLDSLEQMGENKNNFIQENPAQTNVNDNIEVNTTLEMASNTAAGNTGTAATSAGSANATSAGAGNDQMAAILKQLEELKSENVKLKPLADQYQKEKREQIENDKKHIIDNTDSLNKNAENLLKFLVEASKNNTLNLEPEDAGIFDNVSKEISESNKTMPQIMGDLLMADKRAQIGNSKIESGDVWRNIDEVVANLSKGIIACNRGSKYMNAVIEENMKLKAQLNRDKTQAQINNTNIASTSTAVAGVKREVEFSTFDKMRLNSANRMKSLQADPNELPRN
jgi:hypothetical protein